ncbi:MAG: hypothetical protein GY765_22035 [bacterium]|nr:hypothetical protein [bacterium]
MVSTKNYTQRIGHARSAAVIWLLFFLIPASLPARADINTYEDRELRLKMEYAYREPVVCSCSFPTTFTFTNFGKKRKLRLTLVTNSNRYRAGYSASSTLLFDLPPGEKTLRLPLMMVDHRFGLELQVEVGGIPSRNLSFPFQSVDMRRDYFDVLCVGKMDMKKIDILFEDTDGTTGEISKKNDLRLFRVEDVSDQWQSYLGMKGVVVMAPETFRLLSERQRRALKYWVCYGGGYLWLHGPEPQRALDLCALTPSSRTPPGDGSGLPVLNCMTGEILITTNENMAFVNRGRVLSALKRRDRLRELFNTAYIVSRYTLRYRGLFDNLHEVPRWAYILISILIAALVGPVNYVILREKKKLEFFYLTVPLLAVTGMLSMGIYTVVSDGLETRVNEAAMLMHQLDRNEGVVYHARGMYAGIAPREGLQYPAETAAVPFYPNVGDHWQYKEKNFRTDWSSSQKLTGSWLPGRKYCGIFTATPTRLRMGLKVSCADDGSVLFENGLTSAVKKAYALVRIAGHDALYMVQTVAPGAGKTMTPTESYEMKNPFIDHRKLHWVIAAEMEGLPYMETGGIKTNILAGRYYYTAFNSKGYLQ